MAEASTLLNLLLYDVVAALRLGRSVLLQAAMQGHGDVLRYLLQRVSSTNGSTGSYPPSSSPDHHPQPGPKLVTAVSEAFLGAAEQGHSHCLSTLLESSAALLDVDGLLNARNEHGETALMVAAETGREDCVEILLQHSPGAQVTAVDSNGNTALGLAAVQGHEGCVSRLLHHTPQTQVAAANQHGDTALFLAAWAGHAECMELLLQHNPDAQVAAATNKGSTALAFAVLKNHPECVALLLDHSPSVQLSALDDGGGSVVEAAAELGYPQCLDLLLAHNPQPQHLDAAWLAALQQWDETHERTSPHTQCLERLHAKGALLPLGVVVGARDREKNRVFVQDFGSRALVADRANEAIVGLALSARGRKRKASLREAE